MFKNIRVFRPPFRIAIVICIYTLTACQVSSPGLSSQKPTQDIGKEPPALLSSPTLQPTIQKRPADSDAPAAGICATPTEDVALITIAPGAMPDPRCIQVTGKQRLQFKNAAEASVRIQLGLLDLTIPPGEIKTFETPCGDFLETGVHHAVVSSGSVPEIWLAASP